MKFLLKYLAEYGKEKLSLNESSFLSNFKNFQNEYYSDNLNWLSFCSLTSLQLLMFRISLLKKNLWSCSKWPIPEEISGRFSWRQKKRFVFLKTHFLKHLYLLTRRFFSRIYRDGIKNVFHNIWRVFQIAKINHSSSNF